MDCFFCCYNWDSVVHNILGGMVWRTEGMLGKKQGGGLESVEHRLAKILHQAVVIIQELSGNAVGDDEADR